MAEGRREGGKEGRRAERSPVGQLSLPDQPKGRLGLALLTNQVAEKKLIESLSFSYFFCKWA